MTMQKPASKGFTLIEVAIVLILLSLVVGGALEPISTRIQNKKTQRTGEILLETRDALMGYVLLNGRLPCPDSSADATYGIFGDGTEDVTSGNCNMPEGRVPWAEIGAGRMDAWKHPLRYRPDKNYIATTLLSSTNFPKGATGTGEVLKVVQTDGTALSAEEDDSSSRIVAVIFSCGSDGEPNDSNRNAPSSAVCENATDGNDDYDATYAQDYKQSAFDDILIWLPRNMLVGQLVQAKVWTP